MTDTESVTTLPVISDGLTKLHQITQQLTNLKDKEARQQALAELSKVLTIHEAASLVGQVHEHNCIVDKSERFGLYPIKDWSAFARAKQLEARLWPADEVEFTNDRNDFNQLTPEEQKPLLRAFGFFAVGDGSISSMLAYRMILTAPTVEKQLFYVIQLANENVHNEVYGKMIYTLVSDPIEREKIFNAVENVKSIKRMNKLIEDSLTHPDSDRELYIMLCATEYLMFTPLFCNIFWYRNFKRGTLRNCLFSNEQIMRDECLHCFNGCANYLSLPKAERYTDEEIVKIVDRFVLAVDDFADETLSDVNLEELTPENVKQYVRFVADDLLNRLDHKPYYRVSSPFKWMDLTNLIPKTNFYEGTVGEYSRFNVTESIQKAKDLIQGKVEKKKNVYQNAMNFKF